MNPTEDEPFYIGYQPQPPVGLRRWLRIVIVALLALAISTALLLAFTFRRLPLSVFEFGVEREYVGVIRAQPYPLLLIKRDDRLEQFWLVGSGKHAADVNAFVGQSVKLRGTLITRDGLRMLEINSSTIKRLNHASAEALPTESLGRFTFVGEIVDSKCYLGVMNPGHTKPHRECAVRCISGGVPPLFLAHDSQGQAIALQLADAQGEPLSKEVLDFVAEPIEITGEVSRQGEWLTLRANPDTYTRK
ncbi:MAG: hypothetical protein HOP19_02715 [Acidobacteria bacterium]|nr:hypothetical protein [Acidobacteriota bacterium]